MSLDGQDKAATNSRRAENFTLKLTAPLVDRASGRERSGDAMPVLSRDAFYPRLGVLLHDVILRSVHTPAIGR
jgi:hypothetical protein